MGVPGAAQVLISPVVVEMTGRSRTAAVAVTLSDKASRPIRLQTELLRWQQGLRGEAVIEPTDDLLVSPPIAELKPGQRQVFRVALRGARPAAEELAYRLILEDVAEPPLDESGKLGMAINFRMRYDLAVLVAPVGKVVDVLRWKPCSPESDTRAAGAAAGASAPPTVSDKPPASGLDAAACVRLLNAGNRRVKVQTLTLAGDGWQQALSIKDGGENVLAGAEREWRVPLQPGQSGALRGVQVQTARGETLQAQSGGL